MKDAFDNMSILSHSHEDNNPNYKLWLQAILNNPFMSITVLKAIRDKTGLIIDFEYAFINKNAKELLKHNHIVGRRFLEDFSENTKSRFDNLVKVIETGVPWEDEIYYNHEGIDLWLAVKTIKLDEDRVIMHSEVMERKKPELWSEENSETLINVPPDPVFLGTAPATQQDYRRALITGTLIIAAFALTAPWANRQLQAYPAFAPIYNTAVCILDLITAFLLYTQFRQLRKRSFLVLTCAFLFTPILLIAHSLSFPDAFIAGSLIGGSQTTAWLWVGWHTVFPLFFAGYALFRRYEDLDKIGKVPKGSHEPTIAFGLTFAFAIGIILFTVLGERLLPELMNGNQYRSSTTYIIFSAGWLTHLAALIVLFLFTRLRRLIDLWLAVSLVALFIDLALSAMIINGRYQVGFYLGRVYGLLSAGFVLSVLLHKTFTLYESTIKSAIRLGKNERMLEIELERTQLNDISNQQKDEQKIIQTKDTLTEKPIGKHLMLFNFIYKGIRQMSPVRGSRKRTGEKINPQNRFITGVIESIPDMVSVIELPSRNLLYANRKPFMMQGFDADEMLKMTNEERNNLMHPDDIPALEDYFNNLANMKNGGTATLEYRAKNKKGEWLWFYARGNVFERDENGNVKSCVNVLQNITARKEAEKKLRENKDLLQSILDVSTNSLSVLKSIRDSTGDIIDFEYILANKTVEDSIKKGSLTGKKYIEIYSNVVKMGWFDVLKNVVDNSTTADFEKTYNLYGKEDWFHVVAQKFGDGVIVTSSKITERKEAEEAIKEQSHFIHQITDTTPDILYVFDIPGENIVYVNKGVFYSLGYTPEEIYDMKNRVTKLLFHPKDYNRRLSHIDNLKAIQPGEIIDTELRMKDKKGKWHWYNIRETFFKASDDRSTIQILGIGQDVTDRKEAQAAFRREKIRNDELRRINDLMDTFVYAAAHDLKAPVSNLKLVTEVIGATKETALRLHLQNKYPPIIQALDTTISGLISVLAVEKDSHSGAKIVHFQDVFNTVIHELNGSIKETKPEINLDFSHCTSLVYIESYLISIFRNMLSNSFTYRSKERKLIINIESKRSGKYILINFRDNGIGIDLEYYGKDLFKPFKRFSKLSEGSGVGLHLIKNMITKNGGKVEIESKVDIGTTFRIYLVQYNK